MNKAAKPRLGPGGDCPVSSELAWVSGETELVWSRPKPGWVSGETELVGQVICLAEARRSGLG